MTKSKACNCNCKKNGNSHSNCSACQKALKKVKKLVKTIKQEFKKLPNTAGVASVTDTGTVTHLSNIASGSGSNARIGDAVTARYLFGRLSLRQHASSSASDVRIIIFVDKQQVGDGTPTVTNVLAAAEPDSFLNEATVNRFKILRDWYFNVNDAKSLAWLKKFNIKLNFQIRYNGTAATDIQKNGIYILCISDEPSNTPGLVWSIRLVYTDG